MKGAETEHIVPSDHSAHQNPRAIADVLHILKSHAPDSNHLRRPRRAETKAAAPGARLRPWREIFRHRFQLNRPLLADRGSVRYRATDIAGGRPRALRMEMNFMDLSGLVAGSMTDPPVLAFASNIAGSEAPAVASGTVYPLTTPPRILSAQVLAIVPFR